MLPTPTMTAWPGIRRGTDWTVPIPPGLVRLMFAPWKSSTVSLLVLTLRMISSYAARKPLKSSVSHSRITGTSSVRLPSGFSLSTARLMLTCGFSTRRGLPSSPST